MAARIIMLDPPWPETGGCGRGADAHYQTARYEDIWKIVAMARWPDGSAVFDPDLKRGCLIACWTTLMSRHYVPTLFERLGVTPTGHEWIWCKGDLVLSVPATADTDRSAAFVGLDERQSGVGIPVSARVDPAHGMGQWGRAAHEYLVFGKVGPLRPADLLQKWPSWFVAPRGRHSEKPPIAYERVRQMLDGPAVAIFERSARTGFRVWGDEAPAETSGDSGQISLLEVG